MAFIRADLIHTRVSRTRPLVEQTLDSGTLTLLVGQRGTGKTYVALSLAAHLAYGTPWLGDRYVYYDSLIDEYEWGPLVYSSDEFEAYMRGADEQGYDDGSAGWNRYCDDNPWMYTDADGREYEFRSLDYPSYTAIGDNHGYMYQVGYVAAEAPGGTEARLAALGISQQTPRDIYNDDWRVRTGKELSRDERERLLTEGAVLLDTSAVDLTDEHAVDRHCRDLRDADIKFVVYDTLSKCLGGQSDNDPGVMSAVVEGLEQVARVAKQGVLVIHHTGKDGKTIRGSSHLEGAADTIWMTKGNPEKRATLYCEKRRNGELSKFTDVHFRLRPVGDNAVVERIEGKSSEPRQRPIDEQPDASVTPISSHAEDDVTRVIREAEEAAGRTLTKKERVAALMDALSMTRATAYRKVPDRGLTPSHLTETA